MDSPALTVTLPPAPVSPLPEITLTLPAVPLVASLVRSSTDPELPLVELPDMIEMPPLVPEEPAGDV